MTRPEFVPVITDKFIKMMSSCCFGWHIQATGISAWKRGNIADFKGDVLYDGSLLISNKYENDEIYLYFLNDEGEFSYVSTQDLDNDPEFQAFAASHRCV